MLNPDGRRLYLEALKPPVGYSLDRGYAATYSLDLLTLLIVPLSFVLFDYQGEEDLKDQTKVLEALQRTSERMTIYCQRGRISVPKVNSLLYSYLEKTVVEVNSPRGSFHPKTWLLRFAADGQPNLYRFICLTRNLTFDKSWDTLLVLDGTPVGTAQAENSPLIDFMLSLPGKAGKSSDEMSHFVENLREVKFETPPGFDGRLKFWPLGIDGYSRNPLLESADRMLIVSPFVSDGLLKWVTDKTGALCTLVSRMESLDALEKDTIEKFARVFVLDNPDIDENGDEVGQGEYSGLHAKLYVMEQGDKTRVLTGSANATNSAFSSNVEFMVEMRAGREKVSIHTMLSSEKNLFGIVLRDYQPTRDTDETDTKKKQLEAAVDQIRQKLTAHEFKLRADPGEQAGTYDLMMRLEGEEVWDAEEAEVTCWPITLQENVAVDFWDINKGNLIFKNLSVVAVTGFIAFKITLRGQSESSTARFVLNLPLEGLPDERGEKILVHIISDRNRFLRYLLFLLAEEQTYMSGFQKLVSNGSHDQRPGAGRSGIPLMEEMIRALSRNPEKIDRVSRLVQELMKTEEGRQILPEDFDLLWAPIWEARKRMVNNV